MYLIRCCFDIMLISDSSINSQVILSSLDGSCLNKLFNSCQIMIFSTFISWLSTERKCFPVFMAYIFIHLFIPLSKIHRFPFHSMSHDPLHYYLFCCSNCFIFGWWKHLQAGSCVIFNRSSYVFKTSLLFGTIRCSRLILNLACLNHFSKELCCSWWTVVFRNPELGTRYAPCI